MTEETDVRKMSEEELEKLTESVNGAAGAQAAFMAVTSPSDDGNIKLVMFNSDNECLSYVTMPPIVLVAMLSSMVSELTERLASVEEIKHKLMAQAMAEMENEMRDGEMDA